MGVLVLVRHGQASFLEADYDKLSQLGERQAQLLGEHWARLGVTFDRLFHGPRQRQRRTAEIAALALRAAGHSLPELNELPELDELQIDGLVASALPALVEQDPDLAELISDFSSLAQRQPPSRRFEQRLARVFQLWIAGAVQAEGFQRWSDFSDRVARGLQAMRAEAPSGLRVAGFTSAGTITAALQLALRLDAPAAADLMWRVRNSSVTEFLFSRSRFTLSSFNGTPHLEDGALITYR